MTPNNRIEDFISRFEDWVDKNADKDDYVENGPMASFLRTELQTLSKDLIEALEAANLGKPIGDYEKGFDYGLKVSVNVIRTMMGETV